MCIVCTPAWWARDVGAFVWSMCRRAWMHKAVARRSGLHFPPIVCANPPACICSLWQLWKHAAFTRLLVFSTHALLQIVFLHICHSIRGAAVLMTINTTNASDSDSACQSMQIVSHSTWTAAAPPACKSWPWATEASLPPCPRTTTQTFRNSRKHFFGSDKFGTNGSNTIWINMRADDPRPLHTISHYLVITSIQYFNQCTRNFQSHFHWADVYSQIS